MPRYADARDQNEPQIVEALERVGASVERLKPRNGGGLPDLLVGFRGRTYLIEVKLPEGPRGGNKGRVLTPDQIEWHDAWRGAPVAVVRTPEESLRAIGAM